jgi:two-component system response regulator YesN
MSYRVLIADDEQLVIEGLLTNISWDRFDMDVCATALNGGAAYELALTHMPDIVITDIRMPVYSGLELIERVKRNSPKTIFIVYSGYSDFGYAKRSIELDVVYYLIKPSTIEEIEAALTKAVTKCSVLEQLKQVVHESNRQQLAMGAEIGQGSNPSDVHTYRLMEKLKRYMQTHLVEDVSLVKLAEMVHMNPAYLSTLFKSRIGITITDFLLSVRMEHAKKLLTETNLKIWEVSNQSGYSDQRYFSSVFKKHFGLTAGEYRNLFSKI